MNSSIMRISYETEEQWLKLRLNDITSTEVSALFDLNPYMVKPELWHHKKSKELRGFTETERMRWGNILEPVIAKAIAEENNFKIEPMKLYFRDEKYRMGSSFDFEITAPVNAILEIKNVDRLIFKDQWVVENKKIVEAPPHIELQVQHQLAVSQKSLAYIGVLVGGNEFYLLERGRNENIIEKIKMECVKFWNSITDDQPPAWKFDRDAKFISKLYNYAEPGKVVDSDDTQLAELVREYGIYSEQEKKAGKLKESVKAEILTKIGDAEKVLGERFTISCGVVGETEVSYTRKPYRRFNIYFKKEKK